MVAVRVIETHFAGAAVNGDIPATVDQIWS